jgi:hypothetical protein
MRRLLKTLGLGLAALLAAVLLLVSPALYVEAFCHAPVAKDGYRPLITDPERRRQEANTFLTYPEWHIVYAYDGLAEVLKTGDEHGFGYWQSIRDFWVADCALTGLADAHGGADLATRQMVATIGVSFTLEMGLKAAYEETLGRLSALWRGPDKTAQDDVAREMAADYAAFLRQVPWYKYPFGDAVKRLDAAPVDSLRGLERRLALGLEWRAKIAYAGAIASAVAATGEAKLTIFSVVSGLSRQTLEQMADVRVVGETPERMIIETPRYDRFTHILSELARSGGTIREIAGNDDIMLTVTVAEAGAAGLDGLSPVARLSRSGFPGERLIYSVKVVDLAAILRAQPISDPGIEHIFDY